MVVRLNVWAGLILLVGLPHDLRCEQIVYVESGTLAASPDSLGLDGASFVLSSSIESTAAPWSVEDTACGSSVFYWHDSYSLLTIVGSRSADGTYVSRDERLGLTDWCGGINIMVLSLFSVAGCDAFLAPGWQITSTSSAADGHTTHTSPEVSGWGGSSTCGSNFTVVDGTASVFKVKGSAPLSRLPELVRAIIEIASFSVETLGVLATGHISATVIVPRALLDLVERVSPMPLTYSSMTLSHVDQVLEDPEGRTTTKTDQQIPNSFYLESDFSLFEDKKDVIVVLRPESSGGFKIDVTGDEAVPGDVFSLVIQELHAGSVGSEILAESIEVGSAIHEFVAELGVIFRNGFESGDLSAWTLFTPNE